MFTLFGSRLIRISAIDVVEKIDAPGGRGYSVRIQVGNLTYGHSFPSTEETERDDEYNALALAVDP